jgi:hypothetical protein
MYLNCFPSGVRSRAPAPVKLGKGGEISTSKLVVPVALILWCPPRIVGVMGDHGDSDLLERQYPS